MGNISYYVSAAPKAALNIWSNVGFKMKGEKKTTNAD